MQWEAEDLRSRTFEERSISHSLGALPATSGGCAGHHANFKPWPRRAGDPADLAATKAFFTAFAKAADAVGIPVSLPCYSLAG